MLSVDITEAPQVQIRDGWLRVFLGSHGARRHADFHFEWLRHQCECDRHPLTGERTLDPSEIDTDLRVASARIDVAGDALEIVWSEHGGTHASRYPLGWLDRHAYGRDRDAVAPPPSDLALVTRDGSRSHAAMIAPVALDVVHRHGLAVVRGFLPSGSATPDDTERLIEGFASAGLRVIGTHFGRIEDLRTDNTTNENTDQLGYTDAAIQLHTDQPFLAEPPRYQLLHAMRAADVGGDNAIVDAEAAARYLASVDREAFDLLCNTPVRFHRKQRAFERLEVSPILRFDDDRFRVRYSYFTMAPFDLPFERMAAWYRAYRRFAEIVREPAHQFRFRLEPGDFVIYDNHRMLHARTAFRGARWVRGVYFDV